MLESRQISEILAKDIAEAGGILFFGVPGGGSNLDTIGALEGHGCQFVLVHTENAAGVMASVVAELTGRISGAVVTRGPGATSSTNGSAQALLDRQGILMITDCVNHGSSFRNSHQRVDQQTMFAAVAKKTGTLGGVSPGELIASGIELAQTGQPGPIHFDIDPTTASSEPFIVPQAPVPDGKLIDSARALIGSAKNPVVILGVGAYAQRWDKKSAVVAAIRNFVMPQNILTLTTYKARGVLADSAPGFAGIFTGATIEAPVLEMADLVIGIGLDPVEMIPAEWPYRAKVLLLNSWPIDNCSYFGDEAIEITGDITDLLEALDRAFNVEGDSAVAASFRIAAREKLLAAVPPSSPKGLTPQQTALTVRDLAPAGSIATVDAGAHMLSTMPLWDVENPGEVLISSGLATMGYSLPAAIAAGLVHRDRHVFCFTGDGGINMALAELETLARLGLKVIVLVFNDSALSLIEIKQKAEGQGGKNAVHYAPINFAQVGEGMGLRSVEVTNDDELRAALADAITFHGPTLLDIRIDAAAYPLIMNAIRA